ncbi:hypothetical protein NN6n1_22930 [Shinella zoogloeoides]
MTITDLHFLDQEDELLKELGRVTRRWAFIDLQLVATLDVALRNMVVAQNIIFEKTNSGRQRFETFKDCIGVSMFDENERKAIIDCINAFIPLLRVRNELIHEPMDIGVTTRGGSVALGVQAMSRKGIRRDVDIDAIRRHVSEVDVLIDRYDGIYMALAGKYRVDSIFGV